MNFISNIIGLVALVCVLGIILAFPLMWLWNALMPDIFGLMEIGFWQALGLNLLSGILFKQSSSSSN